MAEKDVAHHRFEYGVAEIFEAFVVERFGRVFRFGALVFSSLTVLSVVVATIGKGFVGERNAVDFDVMGIKSQYVVESLQKFLVLAERKFHPVE